MTDRVQDRIREANAEKVMLSQQMCKNRNLRSGARGVEMTATGGCTVARRGSKGGSAPVHLVDEI